MSTIYDWLTMAVFAGLVVLFLNRSDADEQPHDRLWHYLIAALGCAVVNWLGNNGHTLFTLLAGAGLVLFILSVLKPFRPQ